MCIFKQTQWHRIKFLAIKKSAFICGILKKNTKPVERDQSCGYQRQVLRGEEIAER